VIGFENWNPFTEQGRKMISMQQLVVLSILYTDSQEAI